MDNVPTIQSELIMTSAMKGKVALVTGAAQGIGKASAVAFAEQGANVVLADVNDSGGKEVESMINNMGIETLFVKTDISNSAQVDNLISQAVEKFGRIDCAHNNAGIEGDRIPTTDLDEETFDKVLSVNLKGTWLCMKREIEQMLKQGGGSIVNTASVAAFVGLGGLSAYTASKHGIVGLTKTAAIEFAKQKIRVNAVCPGPVKTEMLSKTFESNPKLEATVLAMEPQGRIGNPEEVASAVIWLSSEQSSFVTGTSLVVDGGWTAQ